MTKSGIKTAINATDLREGNPMSKRFSSEEFELGLGGGITRRDVVNGALIGAGAGLLGMKAPLALAGEDASVAAASPTALGPDWTGPGGAGDYARSNGNTHEVVNAAHGVRDGRFAGRIDSAAETGEFYDLVVVGAGFSGFGAAYAFSKAAAEKGRCLVLDNHAIFGGEAKRNEFQVEGYHLYGPQGSSSFLGSGFPEVWRELSLPTEFDFVELSGTNRSVRFAEDYFAPMKWQERASVGHFHQDDRGRGRWVLDAQVKGFRDVPIPERYRHDLNAALHNAVRARVAVEDWDRWLDGRTYKQLFVEDLGLSERVLHEYIDPYLGCSAFGVGGDAISAYGAYLFQMPGTLGHLPPEKRHSVDFGAHKIYAFPGGNSTTLRYLVKRVRPDVIKGRNSLREIGYGPICFEVLDEPSSTCRIRLSSTVVDVRHDRLSGRGEHVRVTYVKHGKLLRVRAKTVVMATGGWINRHVMKDMPVEIATAYQEFHHAPMLVCRISSLRTGRFPQLRTT